MNDLQMLFLRSIALVLACWVAGLCGCGESSCSQMVNAENYLNDNLSFKFELLDAGSTDCQTLLGEAGPETILSEIQDKLMLPNCKIACLKHYPRKEIDLNSSYAREHPFLSQLPGDVFITDEVEGSVEDFFQFLGVSTLKIYHYRAARYRVLMAAIESLPNEAFNNTKDSDDLVMTIKRRTLEDGETVNTRYGSVAFSVQLSQGSELLAESKIKLAADPRWKEEL